MAITGLASKLLAGSSSVHLWCQTLCCIEAFLTKTESHITVVEQEPQHLWWSFGWQQRSGQLISVLTEQHKPSQQIIHGSVRSGATAPLRRRPVTQSIGHRLVALSSSIQLIWTHLQAPRQNWSRGRQRGAGDGPKWNQWSPCWCKRLLLQARRRTVKLAWVLITCFMASCKIQKDNIFFFFLMHEVDWVLFCLNWADLSWNGKQTTAVSKWPSCFRSILMIYETQKQKCQFQPPNPNTQWRQGGKSCRINNCRRHISSSVSSDAQTSH